MAGYSGTPLLKKLGIKPGYRVMAVREPDHYLEMLGELPDGVELLDPADAGPVDFIHLFAEDEAALHNHLLPLKEKLAMDGMLWVSWYKKSSGIETDISGNEVRELGLGIGLVDVKVCAVDENWSGLKFMYRKEDR